MIVRTSVRATEIGDSVFLLESREPTVDDPLAQDQELTLRLPGSSVVTIRGTHDDLLTFADRVQAAVEAGVAPVMQR